MWIQSLNSVNSQDIHGINLFEVRRKRSNNNLDDVEFSKITRSLKLFIRNIYFGKVWTVCYNSPSCHIADNLSSSITFVLESRSYRLGQRLRPERDTCISSISGPVLSVHSPGLSLHSEERPLSESTNTCSHDNGWNLPEISVWIGIFWLSRMMIYDKFVKSLGSDKLHF